MTTAVVVGVAILTATTLGYRFNRSDGSIEQGGILQLGSKPTGASVTINDTPFGSLTTTKLVSQPGDYKVTMDRAGYRQWHKTVPIQSGNITWVTYPRLIPNDLTPQKTISFAGTAKSAVSSGSSKRYAILPDPVSPRAAVAMLDTETVIAQEYTLPDDKYTHASEEHPHSEFTVTKWTSDEKKLLLKHMYGDNQSEWILLNLDRPDESININRTLGLDNIIQPIFSKSDGSEIYALVDGAVRVLDLGKETVSRPLIENAVDFRLWSDDFVLFVAAGDEPHTQNIGYVKKSYKHPHVIKTVPHDGKTNAGFDMGKYYDKYYYLVSYGNQAELFMTSAKPDDSDKEVPLKSQKKFTMQSNITTINVTDSGQFSTVQDGSSFATYNLETNQFHQTPLADGSTPLPQKLEYLDGYLLWGLRDGKLRTYEFDGANQHDIMPLLPELDATLSPSGKYLYAFARDGDNIVLNRVQLLDIKP